MSKDCIKQQVERVARNGLKKKIYLLQRSGQNYSSDLSGWVLLMYMMTEPHHTHLFNHQISLKRMKFNLLIDFFLYQLPNYDNFIMLAKRITFVFPTLTRA